MKDVCPYRLSRREFLRNAGLAAAACSVLGPTAPGGEPSAAPEPHGADFWEEVQGKRVRCKLCPFGCVVGDGQRGQCGVRENRGGRYYSLVYGRPVTVNEKDPVEKKPFFHVYPGSRTFSIATVGCNFHCKFCQNWNISQETPDRVSPPFVAPADIAKAAQRQECRTVAYTYNEPIIFYEYMAECARAAKDLGLGNVMVSNGFISEEPLKKLLPLMTAIKVDFKAFTQKFYGDICGGQLQPVLDTLKRIAGGGVWLEMVMLTIPTLNDNLDDIKKMAEWIVKELGPNVPLHFTRFHPDYKLRNLPPTPLNTLNAARDTAVNQGCRFVYGGNAAGLKDGAGLKAENTYCPKCRTAVVERYGLTQPKITLESGQCPKCGEAIPGVWK
jgi:pyruvate formate lyase activating enzyme